MGNKPRQPITLEDVQQSGPPVRLSDLVAMTGLTEATLKADIKCGILCAQRRVPIRQNSPYYVRRVEARAWLTQMGFLKTNGHHK